MEYSNLYDMIQYLEYGTNLHIGVLFLNNFGNDKCALPYRCSIHYGIMCEKFKMLPGRFKWCFKCRTMAIDRAVRTQSSFGGLCINGIYEYVHPVVMGADVAAIIYVGNILSEEGLAKMRRRISPEEVDVDTMEQQFEEVQCREVGTLLESYIRVLMEKYANESPSYPPLIRKVKEYIHANLQYDISVKHIATLFYYNEIYLGRAFKAETGMTIKEYMNRERINLAIELLKSTDNVMEVSQKTGFNNVTYFNRVFRRLIGQTPSAYKRETTN